MLNFISVYVGNSKAYFSKKLFHSISLMRALCSLEHNLRNTGLSSFLFSGCTLALLKSSQLPRPRPNRASGSAPTLGNLSQIPLSGLKSAFFIAILLGLLFNEFLSLEKSPSPYSRPHVYRACLSSAGIATLPALSGCLPAPTPAGESSLRLWPLRSLKPWESPAYPSHICIPQIMALECFLEISEALWNTQTRTDTWRACSSLRLALSEFPCPPTRQEVCFLLCLQVFLSLSLRTGCLWSKGYHSRISPFVIACVVKASGE